MIATQATKTRQTRVLNIITILAIGALFFLVLLLHSREANAPALPLSYDAILSNGYVNIPVTIASTSLEQEKGLSGSENLPPDAGKLFIFNTPGKYGFWMKDMSYGLDIVWIDRDFRIVGITKGVKPESYPEVFYPPQEVQYVLEVNADFSTENNLSENQLLTLTNILSF